MALSAMASPFRRKYESDINAALDRVTPVPEPQEKPQIDIARAQTLARSTNNPDAQRVGQQMLDQDANNRERAARQAATDQKRADAEAEKVRKAQAQEVEASRKRDVRAQAAQGAATVTDIETGKRTVAKHPDGSTKFETGLVGEPVEAPVVHKSMTAVPGIGAAVATGALGRPADHSGTEMVQAYRNDRGAITTQPLPTKTDAKTGEVSSMVKDPVSGRQVEKPLGVDPVVQAKVAKDAELEGRRQSLALRDNAVKQARVRFNPQWDPVDKEFKAAEKALTDFPATFRRNNAGGFDKIDPKTDSAIPYDPRELDVWQRDRKDAEARLERARAAHDKLAPTALNLERNEREIQENRLRLAEEKIRHDAGMPTDDGGAAGILAKTETGQPDARDAAVLDLIRGVPETAVSSTTTAGNPATTGAPMRADKPLVNPDDAELFASAFPTLQNPEQFTLGDSGDGYRMIKRGGNDIGSIETDRTAGVPFVVLNNNVTGNADLRQLVAFGGTSGLPLYLRDDGPKDLSKEAQWVASVFQAAQTPTVNPMQGDDGTAASANPWSPDAALEQMGATPAGIASKVSRGELSIQHGEAIMRDLYGTTLKADDPLDKSTFGKWLENADPDTKKRWSEAAAAKDTAAKNELTGQFVTEWYLENKWRPGVNFQSRQLAEKALKLDPRTGEKIKAVGGAALEVVGSMVGMLSAPLMATGLGGMSALSDDQDVDTAFKDTLTNYGRASKNTWRGWESNRQKWFTADGGARKDALDKAQTALHAAISTQDLYPEGTDNLTFKADYAQAVNAVTDAAFALHQLNPEKGWEIKREDLDPNTNPAMAKLVNGYMLTGDRSLLDAYFSALMEDHGTRQAQSYIADLTAGKGKFMAAVVAGANAPPEEVGVEIASTLLTAAIGKAVFGGAKAASLMEKGGKAAAGMSRVNRFRMAALGLKDEALAFGMVSDTLANPASKLRKVSNALVKGAKVSAADAITEAGEEAVMGASDRNATANSIASDAAMGALAGFFMGPITGGIGGVMENSRARYERAQAAATFAAEYNKANSGTVGFTPLTREQAETAMALVPPQVREQLTENARAATAELIAAVEGAKGSTDPVALNRLSRAQAASLQAQDALATEAANRVEAIKAVQDTPADSRDFASALAKVAGGRSDLLTGAERAAASSRMTSGGQPYFASVNGADVVTDAGRADALQNFPEIGRLIQSTESQALFEASISPPAPQTDVTNPQGPEDVQGDQGTAQPLPGMAAQPGAQADDGARVDGPAVAGETQIQAEAPVNNPVNSPPSNASAAQLDAVEYEQMRAENPSLPDITATVQAAYAAGAPVSLSMARAAKANPPKGYARQGAQLVNQNAPSVNQNAESVNESGPEVNNPGPEGAPVNQNGGEVNQKTSAPIAGNPSPAISNTTREVAGRVRANVERSTPGLKGRIQVTDQGYGTGGVFAGSDGVIYISLPDLQTEIGKSTPKATAAALEQLIVRHEAVHIVQYGALQSMWEEQGSPGDFARFFLDWYGNLYTELSESALDAARKIYGESAWDSQASDAHRAAELVRMLVEAKLDPDRADEFSELFRAVAQSRPASLIEMLRKAVELLTDLVTRGQLSAGAQAHVDQIVDLYNELVSAQESTPQETAKTTKPPQEAAFPEKKAPKSNESASELPKNNSRREMPDNEVSADRIATMQVVNDAVKEAIASNPALKRNNDLRVELDDLIFDMADALEQMPAAERRAVADEAIAGWVEEKLPKKREIYRGPNAREILNSGNYLALSKLYESGTKIMPRPNLLSLIESKKRQGKKLTNAEIELVRNDPEYNGAVYQNQFANSGGGKVAREIIAMLTARQGEGTRPDVMAGYLGEGKTADEMWQEIGKELNAIANGTLLEGREQDPTRDFTDAEIAAELAKQPKQSPEQAQDERFDDANVQTATSEPFAVEDFTPDSVGGVVTVDGEEMRITAVNMDSLGVEVESVVLDDHTRFGRQILQSGEVVYIEAGQVGDDALFSSPSPAPSSGRSAPVDIPDALVAHELGAATKHPEYAAAKAGDNEAALRLARDMVTKKMREDVQALIGENKPIIVPVLAIESAGHNKIPLAVAIRLEESLGLKATNEIYQSVKANRGGKSALDRVFSPAGFDGPVTPGQTYLLVDDTLTQGGTFAALADHITRNGGKVVGAVALTGKQYSASLRLSEGLLTQLRELHGQVEPDFRRATGHGFERLTESEARTLIKFKPSDGVRSRIVEEGHGRVDGMDAGPEGQTRLASSPSSQRSFDFGTSGDFSTRTQAGFDFTPAEKVEAAASLTDTDPTEGQKEAGNYRKGKVTLHGMTVSIENPRGSIRSGTDKGGKVWEIEMPHHYGYFLGTEARDGDHMDTFIGPDPESNRVFIVNQVSPETGRFDEHKVMIGFNDRRAAIDGYQASYSKGWKGLGSMVETDVDTFREWLENGDTQRPARLVDFTKTAASTQAGTVTDFGEKMHGARKDRTSSLSREISDKEIGSLPLSQIWPKGEVDAIEDRRLAAIAYATRSEIPAKPRKGYKLDRWVQQVKSAREVMRLAESIGIDEFMKRMDERSAVLAKFADKIRLLQQIDRTHWDRIGEVNYYPNAYRYDTDGKQVPSPYASAMVDGKRVITDSFESLQTTVNELVGVAKTAPKMQFEVRRSGSTVFINKKGDPLRRRLKDFDDPDSAFQFIRNNHDALAAAWEAVKDSDNVKEIDLRSKENRPRSAKDHREGKDATPEMFTSAFGFRGVEFGNWVSQGKNSQDRQGMLNQAYDALLDLSDILGIPSRAVSLNGSLGLAFGSRGHGWASAHYEPTNLVINLTKTRGAGSLAHEWFHALDNYFQLKRPTGGVVPEDGHYITSNPERYFENKKTGHRLSANRFNQIRVGGGRFDNIDDWKPVEGVRPQVEEAFAALVEALNNSPMAARASKIDAGKSGGYWSQIIERAARSFESHVIAKMQEKGYHNDYLANVVGIEEFSRDPGRYPYLLADEIAPVSAAFDDLFSSIKSKETDQGVMLYSSPTPDASVAVQTALSKMPPIYRQVFEAVSGGASEAEVMKRFRITDRAVKNILDQVRSRITTATTAASKAGLKPQKKDSKFDGGRPDLALSGNAQVTAIDQIRNESGVPDVRPWEEVNGAADKLLADDYQGTYDAILGKARDLQSLTDVEVSAAKKIIARETMAGKIQTPADRVKLAMLIHGYRDIGTETARQLAIRRDPTQKPAERHAQFIAEALFTPDQATRARLREAGKGEQETILSGWMSRVDAIKADLLAQGIDIDASLAAFNERQEARKEAEAESPRVVNAIETAFKKRTKREKLVIEAIRGGALASKAALLTGMSVEEIKPIWISFIKDYRQNMRDSAKRFFENALASSPSDFLAALEAEFGIFDWDAIDDTKPGFVDRRNEKPRKERKPKEAAPETSPLTPEQETALAEAFERFRNADPATWSTFWQEESKTITPMIGQVGFEQFKGEALKPWRDRWQEEMEGVATPAARITFDEWISKPANGEKINRQTMLFPEAINETRGTWSEERGFSGQGELFRPEVNETTGEFDLNDPVSVKQVLDAFALARGTKMDALMEYWRMSILTGPQTHIVNTGSNLLNLAYNLLPRRGVEATINSLLGVAGQGESTSATLGEFVPMVRNLRKGVQLGARNALRSWQLESRTFEAYARAEAIQLDFTGVGAEYIPPALGGKIGKVMRSLSFRAMTAADEFMKSVYAQMEVAAQAHRMAKAENLEGDAYSRRIDELMEPGSAAWLRAIDGAKKVTFQEDLDGSGLRSIRRLDQLAQLAKTGRAMPWLGKPLTFFLPFIDTPTNIFKMAVEMSPVGAFLAVTDAARALRRRVLAGNLSKEEARREAELIYDRARFVQDLTNQTIAWATFFALQGMVGGDDDDLPVITGTVPYKTTRRGERDNAHAVMPPQTIRLGDTQFSYSRVEPFATMLASTVDLLTTIRRQGGVKPAVASEWLMRFKDQAKDKTFLQGVSNLINAVEDPDRFAERLASNIVTGFVPNLARQPLREADTTLRDQNPRPDDGFLTSLAKRVGYSLAPQAAPVKYDVWGEPVKPNRGEMFGNRATDLAFRILDPTNATFSPKIDPLDAWIFKWNLQTADPKERVSIEPIPSSISGKVPGEKNSRKFALTEAEQAKANQEAGRQAKAMLGTGWDKQPLSLETAERITEAVRNSQKIQKDILRMQKVNEAMATPTPAAR